jgi:glycosyltransferase involved in cell wall biosynthesis
MPSVLEKYPNTLLYIIGDGKLCNSLSTQIENLGLQNSIKLLGVRSDVFKILRASDIFIMPSLWEGLPVALLEAMLMECPIIISDVEGIDDVLTHNENGLITPLKDVAILSKSILYLMENKIIRNELGIKAREHILENFSEDEMCKQYEEVFFDLA